MLKNPVILLSLCLSVHPLVTAQDVFETPRGRIVQAYFEAFNSGNDTMMQSFFLEHLAASALLSRPAPQRVGRMKQMRAQLKSLRPVDVRRMDSLEIEIAAEAGNGDTPLFIFEFEAGPPFKMTALRVELGETSPRVSGPLLTRDECLAFAEAYLDSVVRSDRFSGTVLMARAGTVLFHKAYGLADKTTRRANTLDTRYNLGSIGKLFTRIAIAQLVEQGKLSLEDVVGRHLTEYPNKMVANNVRVRHLLDMSSGMGDFFGEAFDRTPKDGLRSLTDYLPLFVDDSLAFEPGEGRRYSNAGYILLGLIIEKLSGMDYDRYVRRNIFEPAGMTHSDWFERKSAESQVAIGYTPDPLRDGAWVPNTDRLPRRGSSAGGVYSTTGDLVAFTKALRTGILLTPPYTEWVLTGSLPAESPVMPLRDGAIGVAGGAPGVNSCLEFDAGSGDTIIVLGNYEPPVAQNVASYLRSLLMRWRP